MLAVGVYQSLRAFFRGGTPGFKPLERQVLDGVVEQLDADRAAKLRERLARINLVQGLDGGREANVYEMKDGKPVIDGSLRLADAKGEKVLAEFTLTTAGLHGFVKAATGTTSGNREVRKRSGTSTTAPPERSFTIATS